MKLLIVGANGQLGKCLQDRVADSVFFEATACSSQALDIRCLKSVRDKIGAITPDAVVNAAAYTAVDKAEDDSESAYSVNHLGVKNLAEVCEELSLPLVHISTDYVFDGQANRPYLPDSPTAPIGVYGKSKLEGEKAASAALASLVIIRTAWVYSEYGNNFVKTMLRLAESRDEVSVVGDQLGCPTYAGNIASIILTVCKAIFDGKCVWGTYHYVDAPEMTWADFSMLVFSAAAKAGLINKDMRVKAISSEEYPTKADRPAYSVLDTSSFQQEFGVNQAKVDASLAYVIGRI